MTFTFATNCWPLYPDWPLTLAYCVPLFLLPLLFSNPVPPDLRLARLSFAPILLCSASGFQGFNNMLGRLAPLPERNVDFLRDSLVLLRTPFLTGAGLSIIYCTVSLAMAHVRRRRTRHNPADASSLTVALERIVLGISLAMPVLYAVLLVLPFQRYNHLGYADPESGPRTILASLTLGSIALAMVLGLPFPGRRLGQQFTKGTDTLAP